MAQIGDEPSLLDEWIFISVQKHKILVQMYVLLSEY